MNKIAILLDNLSPKHLNLEVFKALGSTYEKDKNSSINLFVKNVNWPFKNIPYGVFKISDYNGFDGDTICTNLELLNCAIEIPNNNKMILYCHDFPWIDTRIPVKNMISILTNPEIDVYCRVDYIQDFLISFGKESKVCSLNDLIKGTIWR